VRYSNLIDARHSGEILSIALGLSHLAPSPKQGDTVKILVWNDGVGNIRTFSAATELEKLRAYHKIFLALDAQGNY